MFLKLLNTHMKAENPFWFQKGCLREQSKMIWPKSIISLTPGTMIQTRLCGNDDDNDKNKKCEKRCCSVCWKGEEASPAYITGAR